MNRVYKYPLPVNDLVTIAMPRLAHILTAHAQHGEICVWALVNPDEQEVEQRTFRIAGTGHDVNVPINCLRYIGSAHLHGGSLVFHIFEVLP